jgi:type IV pilus assembly protein PilA
MTLQRKQQGFTIVELLVVIVVIGILALITVTTFAGVTQRSRDAKRQSDVNAIHGQLEAYYAQNSKYPTLANLNDATFRTANMKGLDPAALQDPSGANNTVVAAPVAKAYAYAVTPSGCDNSTTDCTGYTLTATKEGGGTYVKNSLN